MLTMPETTARHNRRVKFRRREMLRLMDLNEELAQLLERLLRIGDEIDCVERRVRILRAKK